MGARLRDASAPLRDVSSRRLRSFARGFGYRDALERYQTAIRFPDDGDSVVFVNKIGRKVWQKQTRK